jgi:DNA helicase-2/ATP-dependent DNA helicase PcrA
VLEAKMPFGGAYQNFGGNYGTGFTRSRFDEEAAPFNATYETPGWQRAQEHAKERTKAQTSGKWSRDDAARARGPITIEGELVASSASSAAFRRGERVMHQKFGHGTVSDVDGNKLTIDFDNAGRKRVIDSFLTRG